MTYPLSEVSTYTVEKSRKRRIALSGGAGIVFGGLLAVLGLTANSSTANILLRVLALCGLFAAVVSLGILLASGRAASKRAKSEVPLVLADFPDCAVDSAALRALERGHIPSLATWEHFPSSVVVSKVIEVRGVPTFLVGNVKTRIGYVSGDRRKPDVMEPATIYQWTKLPAALPGIFIYQNSEKPLSS